jgi:hypothetical protein
MVSEESPNRGGIVKIEVNVAELKEVEKDRVIRWWQVFGNGGK